VRSSFFANNAGVDGLQGEAQELLPQELRRFEESAGSSRGRAVAALCSCAPAGLWGVTGLAAAGVVRSAPEISPAPAAGPGQVSAALLPVCTAEMAISVTVYTVLFNYYLRVPPPVFILGFDSVCFLPGTGSAASHSVILGGQCLPSCLSPSFSHTTSFAAPAFLQKHVLCLASLNNVIFVIKSGIICNRAPLAKHFHDGFPKQV